MALEETGQATDTNPEPTFGQSGTQLVQKRFGFGLISLPVQVGLGPDGVRALIAAHRHGLYASFPHEGLMPAYSAGGTDLEQSGGFLA
mgnify:FL=1